MLLSGVLRKKFSYSRSKLRKKYNHSKQDLKEKYNRSKDRLREKLKVKFVLFSLCVLFFFFFVATYSSEVKEALDGLILAYGLIAVFLIAFLSDAIMQPIGPDVPILTGILLGLNPILVFLVALAASGLATIVGYYVGRKYGAKGFRRFYGKERYKKLIKTYNKYHFIVPIAAITPIPYVPVCWISGIMKMHKIKFLLYSIGSRGVRLFAVTVFAASIS